MSRKAFTLIELLVVIAIIAILAAILFPVFAQAKEAAKKTVCISNTRQISIGIYMYTSDYDDTYPQTSYEQDTLAAQSTPGFAGTYNPQNPLGKYQIHWTYLIQPYVKNWNIFVCPSDGHPITTDNVCTNGIGEVGTLTGGVMTCDWSAQKQSYIPVYNALPAHDWSVVNATEFASPSNQIVVAEHRDDGLVADDHKGTSGFYPSQPCGTLNGGTITTMPAVGTPVAPANSAANGYTQFTADFLQKEWAWIKANGAPGSTPYKNGFKAYDAIRVAWDVHSGGQGSNYSFADGHSKYQNIGQVVNPTQYEFGDQWYPKPQPWNSNPNCS
jgi:prepilin-type N-terminal cleavage/methylation domain-containing protein/prepilin-type processing-associated H-X9-DG protein